MKVNKIHNLFAQKILFSNKQHWALKIRFNFLNIIQKFRKSRKFYRKNLLFKEWSPIKNLIKIKSLIIYNQISSNIFD